jgi:hypothetical protein
MTLQLATMLEDKLQRGDERSARSKVADLGDQSCCDAYIEPAIAWAGRTSSRPTGRLEQTSPPQKKFDAFRRAFRALRRIGRDKDAMRVALDLAKARAADNEIGKKLEEIAAREKNLDALAASHEILLKDLQSQERAEELVRQAEMMVVAGADSLDAMQHGEAALTSVPPAEVEPLLARLGKLTQAPGHIVDLYERNVGR